MAGRRVTGWDLCADRRRRRHAATLPFPAGDKFASVPPRAWRRRLEAPRAVVTQEVVARKDVVHLQAFGTGEPLADIALKERFMADDRGALAVTKEGLRRHPSARLASDD